MRVLLTQSRPQAAFLAAELEAAGLAVLAEPMLEIEPVAWDPAALADLTALVVTSANAAPALNDVAHRIADRPAFAVGPGTAAALAGIGLGNVHEAAGTAEDLLRMVMAKRRPQDGTIVHFSGRDVSVDCAAVLAGHGYAARRVVVYRAMTAPRLSAAAAQSLRDGTLGCAVFLSPRAAANFAALCRAGSLVEHLAGLSAVVMSPRIAAPIEDLPWRHIAVAAEPSRRAVLAAIQELTARC